MTGGAVAVLDIGKTNVKVALVDPATLTELAVLSRPNAVLPGPPWPHFDVEGHWAFLLDALRQLRATHEIDAISVTTHGASVALLDDGRRARRADARLRASRPGRDRGRLRRAAPAVRRDRLAAAAAWASMSGRSCTGSSRSTPAFWRAPRRS